MGSPSSFQSVAKADKQVAVIRRAGQVAFCLPNAGSAL